MRACSCGETLPRSVQENAAKTTAATKARVQLCERAELFIVLGACDNAAQCASNFVRQRSFVGTTSGYFVTLVWKAT